MVHHVNLSLRQGVNLNFILRKIPRETGGSDQVILTLHLTE
jgi:hypothetical protein